MGRIGESTMKDKKDLHKCWICKDSGMVFFNKYKYGIPYEFAYRCTCILGQNSSSKIMTVPDVLAENIAVENYISVEKLDSKKILEFKEKLKGELEFVGRY